MVRRPKNCWKRAQYRDTSVNMLGLHYPVSVQGWMAVGRDL
jgi:hypothetical protein